MCCMTLFGKQFLLACSYDSCVYWLSDTSSWQLRSDAHQLLNYAFFHFPQRVRMHTRLVCDGEMQVVMTAV